jgi:CRP-like cAMP-binding protein
MPSEFVVAALLGRTELFGPLAEADRTLIARAMHGASFQPGQTIFERGDLGHEVYLVVEGRVRLAVETAEGRTVSFRHACAGDIFGEIAALDRGVRTAAATALTPVVAKTLAQGTLDSLIAGNPRVARAAIEYLCKRLRDTSEQVESIALLSLEVRVARFLLAAMKSGREASGAGAPRTEAALDFDMSQAELAALIGGSRQKVNAALARLEALGAIRRLDGKLVINVRELARIAEVDEA